jgi:prepilin-type N-terminal cleavage/methylation domain-containing protein
MIRRRPNSGFSLIELVFVLSLIAILVAFAMPDTNPSVTARLTSAAQALEGDLAYCQSLAMTHNSTYRVQFDVGTDQYYLEHTGSNSALDQIAAIAIESGDVSSQTALRFSDRPHIGPYVVIDSVEAVSGPSPAVDDVEFGPLGQTTRTEETAIWRSSGTGDGKRYLAVIVNPRTGLTRLGSASTSASLAAEEVILPIE